MTGTDLEIPMCIAHGMCSISVTNFWNQGVQEWRRIGKTAVVTVL